MISNGKYQKGESLPTVRDLAIEAGVNPNTVQRAYSELEREGLVISDRTIGRYVSDDEKLIDDLRKSLSEKYISEMYKHLYDLGLDKKMIKDALKKWEEKE